MFQIETPPYGTVQLIGRLDAAQVPNAEQALAKLQGTVTIDFAKLEYISSAGLGLFIGLHKRLADAKGSLTLTGMTPHIRHIFALARLDLLLTIK